MFISALARRPSIQMRFLYVQMCSRSTLVDPNAFLMCSDVFSLDACQSKCVFLYALMYIPAAKFSGSSSRHFARTWRASLTCPMASNLGRRWASTRRMMCPVACNHRRHLSSGRISASASCLEPREARRQAASQAEFNLNEFRNHLDRFKMFLRAPGWSLT